MPKRKEKTTVNGNRYHIVIKETNRRRRVSVYDDNQTKKVRKKTDIVYRREWKGRFLWWGKDTATPVETMVRECLNEAVCILEDKQEHQEKYQDKVEQAIDAVKEGHDE